MFHVWDITGIQRPFTPGTLRPIRRVEPSRKLGEISAIGGQKGIAASSQAVLTTTRGEHAYAEASAKPDRREVLCAQDIMSSPVVCVPVGHSVGRVQAIMTEKRFRHLPVANDLTQLVGIVSERDVLRFFDSEQHSHEERMGRLISETMAAQVLTATPETEIRELARVMFEEHVGALPIVDHNGELVGIVTRSDILRTLVKHGPMHLWV